VPTILENYFDDQLDQQRLIAVDQNRLAIGTDQPPPQPGQPEVSPLRDGVQWMSRDFYDDDPRPIVVPQTYAYYRCINGQSMAPYNADANYLWLYNIVSNAHLRPDAVYVFHARIVTTLGVIIAGLSGQNSRVSANRFALAYKGSRNATFNEMMIILTAGYCTVNVQFTPETAHNPAIQYAFLTLNLI
jgi:hypothetical protein